MDDNNMGGMPEGENKEETPMPAEGGDMGEEKKDEGGEDAAM